MQAINHKNPVFLSKRMFMPLDIRSQNLEEITSFVEELGEKAFRARQLYEWLWKKNAGDFEQMSNLPQHLRERLKEKYIINRLNRATELVSIDKTRKYGFRASDDLLVEGVLIPAAGRVTACISSQIGCPLNCSFCATSRLKSRRNLETGEIIDQVHLLQESSLKAYGRKLSNLVLMGMGEPLLNYENVMRAISLLTSEEGTGISPRRITLSTVGLADGIRRLGDDKVRFPLAISLHSADEQKRSLIMPVNKSNPLSALAGSIQYFHRQTGTRVTYEYLLMKDFNDSLADAGQLAEFCRITPCKVNLIEYNEVEGSPYKRSPKERFETFAGFLESKNMVVNIRRSRGHDIAAACGQLAGQAEKKGI